ncbi:MAG: hypothetical protein HQ488_03890 [Parcubacteria group bacterium]|nr:hypothetical protein [Parcubacteria group bacterium]
MTLIKQSWELMSGLASRVPWGQIKIQPLIDDIANVGPEFIRFLENGGRVQVGPNPILDFDTDPHIPEGWSIHLEDQIASRLTGRWELDASKIGLHLDAGQRGGKSINGDYLKPQLEGKPVFPAHVLDHWIAHPEKIPEFLKGKLLFFWGTIYRSSDWRLCVRCLYWDGERWDWSYNWLVDRWSGRNPCAVSAS